MGAGNDEIEAQNRKIREDWEKQLFEQGLQPQYAAKLWARHLQKRDAAEQREREGEQTRIEQARIDANEQAEIAEMWNGCGNNKDLVAAQVGGKRVRQNLRGVVLVFDRELGKGYFY